MVFRLARLAIAAAIGLVPGVALAASTVAGQTTYAARCAACHGAALAGSAFAPALTGAAFKAKWGARPDALLAFIRANMPPGQQQTLGDADRRAIAAYILSAGGQTAGAVKAKP